MKTLQNKSTGKLKREHEVIAQSLVNGGEWTYIAKSFWKQYIGGEALKETKVANRASDLSITLQNPLKKNKMSKAAKRHLRRKK
tara:strand:- start:451 stop:702 length:252 start_codon:yes stop_codon:yes gene_type:complete